VSEAPRGNPRAGVETFNWVHLRSLARSRDTVWPFELRNLAVLVDGDELCKQRIGMRGSVFCEREYGAGMNPVIRDKF